jgi:hypothetical protein
VRSLTEPPVRASPSGLILALHAVRDVDAVRGDAEMSDLETPDEDAVEQETAVLDEDQVVPVEHQPIEVDDGDLAESSLEVPLDEDDYR